MIKLTDFDPYTVYDADDIAAWNDWMTVQIVHREAEALVKRESR